MNSEQIGETLHNLMHAYKRALRSAHHSTGLDLSISHIRVLKVVNHIADCTAHAVGIRLRRDKSQITRLVRELLDQGLIDREPHQEDKRSQILRLTEKGRTVVTKIKTVEQVAAAEMVRGLSDHEIELFTRLSQAMIANLGETN